MITPEQLAERMKNDILCDVAAGRVPPDVKDFSQLHDFVDANCYGGADEIFGEMVTESVTDAEHQAKLDAFTDIANPAMEIINNWLAAGGIAEAQTQKPGTVRITVWRLNAGPPVAVIGDTPPGQGWHQDSKADLADPPHPRRLHELARAFLIRSSYHVRDPFLLSVATENFGVACQKLGYSLPLKEEEHTWPVYEASELDRGTPDQYQMMLGHIATVFGKKAALEQAKALDIKWPAQVSGNPEPNPGHWN